MSKGIEEFNKLDKFMFLAGDLENDPHGKLTHNA